MALLSSKILDEKYEILHEIKKGGFGIVYYGIDRRLNKPVAIKEIAPNLLDDSKYLDMFQEEALNIAKLSHNNIVRIYELKKTSDAHFFIIMEYIDGVDLEKIIRKTKRTRLMPLHLAAHIMAEVCMALDYAHQRHDTFTNKPLKLVHQDVSPSNIMISRNGEVKLIDFGIASVRRHRKDNQDNKLRGKIPYLAPEQLLMGSHPDHRSDIFSLGLVLYEAVTGERMFNTREEVLAAGKNHKIIRKAVKTKRLPNDISRIIHKAIEVEMDSRYQNSSQMYFDLMQFILTNSKAIEPLDELSQYIRTEFSNGHITPQPTPFKPITEKFVSSPPSVTFKPETKKQPPPKPAANRNYQFAKPPISENKWDITPPRMLPANLQSGQEELHTVIDVIRVAARNNKKRIWLGLIALLSITFVFGILDTTQGWTPAGTWISDIFFPPTITISTLPPNAQVFVNGKQVEGRTPVSIANISPGVHKLQLSLPGYKALVKSLFVPRDGEIAVQGKNGSGSERNYIFRFNIEIRINSVPEGAEVFINGTRLNRKTPCKILWEVGNDFAVELFKPGFDRLGGYTLDTSTGRAAAQNGNLWQTERKSSALSLTGTFAKKVVIETIPDGVEVYDRLSNEFVGITGPGKEILLTAGQHQLELRKGIFNPKPLTVIVDKTLDKKIQVVLTRTVRFSSNDEMEPGKDLKANLISLKTGRSEFLKRSKKTPFELELPAYSFTGLFSKIGYQNKEIRIGPRTRTVRINLEPVPAAVEITVVDGLTNAPLENAEIFLNLFNSQTTTETLFGRTAVSGRYLGRVVAGNYLFKVKKPGYHNIERSFTIKTGEKRRFDFRLYPSN